MALEVLEALEGGMRRCMNINTAGNLWILVVKRNVY